MRSQMNESGEELPLRTFHNHRNAVMQMFDINIECDKRGGYKYYIENSEDMERGGVRQWLLNTFAVNNRTGRSKVTNSTGNVLEMYVDRFTKCCVFPIEGLPPITINSPGLKPPRRASKLSKPVLIIELSEVSSSSKYTLSATRAEILLASTLTSSCASAS